MTSADQSRCCLRTEACSQTSRAHVYSPLVAEILKYSKVETLNLSGFHCLKVPLTTYITAKSLHFNLKIKKKKNYKLKPEFNFLFQKGVSEDYTPTARQQREKSSSMGN